MGKTSKWIRSILVGKKGKEKMSTQKSDPITSEKPTTPISTSNSKEKRRWSFRRSSATAPPNSGDPVAVSHPAAMQSAFDAEIEHTRHAMAVAAATAAAADAAVAAAQAAAAIVRLTAAATSGRTTAAEDAAAVKIQSVFRSYLARKALCALKGLVKLQALVRGHLVRRQAVVTLRCMQALLTVQARARAQRIRMAGDGNSATGAYNQKPLPHRRSTQENRSRHSFPEMDRGMEENIKIVEMDSGEPRQTSSYRNSYINNPPGEQGDHRFSPHYVTYSKYENSQVSPAPSALTEMSPKAYSSHLDDYSFTTAQSSPHYYTAISKADPAMLPSHFPHQDYAESMSYDYPSYMANTQSSRAKARSQSAPKQRPADSLERQPTKRRPSVEGRNIPRSMRMQRSSSHVGTAAQNYQYPWSVKLDRSSVSLKDSECGSTSTMLTNTTYCRTIAGFEKHHEDSRMVMHI